MSGVFGYCDPDHRERIEPTLARMAERLRHRSFHRTNYATPAAGVGLGRHAGGVLNPAPQPVHADGHPVSLCLCGELYYQQDRRRDLVARGRLTAASDDTALALGVYLDEGSEGLARLNGAFTIAVWDGRTRELLLVNDRFGLYPHYFARVGGRFAFAPEIKSVLAAPDIPRDLDLTAIAEYVRFQQLLGDKTWLDRVRLLPPASVLRYHGDGGLTIRRYWDWDRLETRWSTTDDETIDDWDRLFGRAVRARAERHNRLGLYLSGGLDSRLILAFLQRAGRPVSTFTYGAPDSRDAVFAGRVAHRAGAAHHLFPYADGRWLLACAARHLTLTEGMHAWQHAHGLDTVDTVRSSVDVAFTGWRCGYRHVAAWWFGQPRARTARPMSEIDLTRHLYEAFCERCTWPGLTEGEAGALFSGDGDPTLRWRAFDSLRSEVKRTAHYPPERRADCFYTQQHDRRSTANLVVFTLSAVDVEMPWFDYDFVDFIYSLPTHIDPIMTLRGRVLTRTAASLARVPYDKDARLPHDNPIVRASHAAWHRARSILSRRISPGLSEHATLYADYEQWLRTDLRGWAETILFDERTRARGLFDPQGVRALWDRHLAGRELWTIGKIAPLITIELVLRMLDDSG